MVDFKLVNGQTVQLSASEQAERKTASDLFASEPEAEKRRNAVQLAKRQEALAAKWKDPFALIDDVLARGIATVKTERDAIKEANPTAAAVAAAV